MNMKWWRRTELALANIAFWTLASNWFLSFWFWKELPREPDPANGYTIALIEHGVTVYLNLGFWAIFYGAFWGGLFLFFFAAMIDLYKNPFQRWRQ
jgi:hypothetical protein